MYSGFAATRGYDLLAFLGAAGCGSLVLGILTATRILVASGLVILAVEYAASLLTQDVREAVPAVLFATVFFVTAELAYWSLELRTRSAAEPGILSRRFMLIAALGLGGFACTSLVLGVAASATPGPSLLLEAVGVGAAVAVAVLGVRLARRATSPPAS